MPHRGYVQSEQHKKKRSEAMRRALKYKKYIKKRNRQEV